MGFGRLALGLASGLTIPFIVHDNVYYAIATCFYYPHLKYYREKEKRSAQKAIPLEHLDYYVKDVAKSFLLFWLIIGPTVYKTYYTKENILEGANEQEYQEAEDALNKPDSFSELLKKVKKVESDGTTATKRQMKKIIAAEPVPED